MVKELGELEVDDDDGDEERHDWELVGLSESIPFVFSVESMSSIELVLRVESLLLVGSIDASSICWAAVACAFFSLR